MSGKITLIVVALLLAAYPSRAAENGSALYKKKCAGCHGAAGEGKPSTKVPALKGTSLDANQIVEKLTKGDPGNKAPHKKGMAGLSEHHAKEIADYVKTLQ